MDVDIIQDTSMDVEYTETNYRGQVTNPFADHNKVFNISTNKIYEKKFKDITYLKLELPFLLSITTTEKVLVLLTRNDYFQLRILTSITNNILFFKTNDIQWSKWVSNKPRDLNYTINSDTDGDINNSSIYEPIRDYRLNSDLVRRFLEGMQTNGENGNS